MTTDVRLLCQKHSPKLTSIPRGLYHYIDKQGGKIQKYRPGSKWCYKCGASCYKQPGLPANERRKENKEKKRLTNDIDVEEAQQLYRVEKEKCEELKKELTAVQSQLSEMQGFTDKQKSFCSLSV